MRTAMIAVVFLLNSIVTWSAEPATKSGAAAESYNGTPTTNTTDLIGRLNTLVTNNASGGEDKAILQMKQQLATQGITIYWLNSQYVDATALAENGQRLSREDKEALAVLNFLEQNDGMGSKKTAPGFKPSGESRSRMALQKQKLAESGFSVTWDKDKGLYVVTSTSDAGPKAVPR